MDDLQVGVLRLKKGVVQIQFAGKWRPVNRTKIEEVLWLAIVSMDERIKNLEHSVDVLSGRPD